MLLAIVHARTDVVCRVGPGLRRLEVHIPEWPGAALQRPDGINAADALAVDGLQIDAIAVRFFGERVLEPDAAQNIRRQPLILAAQELRDAANLFARDPDVPRRARAAVAALR